MACAVGALHTWLAIDKHCAWATRLSDIEKDRVEVADVNAVHPWRLYVLEDHLVIIVSPYPVNCVAHVDSLALVTSARRV